MTADRPGRSVRIAALVAAVLLTLGSVLAFVGVGPTPTASATPGDDPDTNYASVALTDVTPSTVTSSSGRTVGVRGRITNTFDRPIHDVIVRLQRSDAATSTDLRTVLAADASVYDTVTEFTKVATTLAPHETVDFAVDVPLSAGGLQISQAGVYPLLVNVNGTPDYGGQARIADSRTMLPVLSLPADRARARQWVEPGSGTESAPLLGRDGSVAANDTNPAAFTFLWPLAAPPQQAAGTLGGDTADIRLISDDLTSSLEDDGRLGKSLQALETVAGIGDGGADKGRADKPEDRVRNAICLAVDPDLVSTVQSMASGYSITEDPSDPDAQTRDGDGSTTARKWLARLTRVASGMCVTALPYAQAGLDSLERIDNDQLTDMALNGAYDTVDAILGVTSVRGLTVPATGTVSPEGRTLLEGRKGSDAAAVVSTAVDPSSRERRGSGLAGRYKSGGLPVQTYDPGVSAALGSIGDRPVAPSFLPEWQRPSVAGESAASRRQTAAASLAFPMLDVAAPSSDESSSDISGSGASGSGTSDPVTATTGRSAFTMPPTYWSPTSDDARSLLNTARLMVASGTADPVPLTDVIAGLGKADRPADLVVPGDVDQLAADGYPLSSKDLADVRRDVALIGRLEGSFATGHDLPFTPAEYIDPLRADLLRTVSTPSTTNRTVSRVERPQRLAAVGSTLTRMQQSVSLLDPSGRYTLASERSPLLLVVRNELALPIKVSLDITAPPELSVGDVGVVEIPAKGTRQLQLPTHASSSQPATVRIALVTTNNVPLSSPVDLSIYANAYGKALFWITIAAGVILVLLTARRLWHRFRGEPDPADEDRPEPDEYERHLASTGYQQRLAAERVTDTDEREEPDPGERG
ncbi:DUF6049 family protein [Gordonia sp. HY002]|uniref:DUF6049 family protein n=1 Tax=Gordonia zhenghanii TaxID=2911516 RepID=UPI001EF12F68|nr:DUF6049 family protein [Gordonia zhenghanii]MCF8571725.1 DUF6049 family protein [Gordonia zhenghanii]MCF8602749.1 DUF6049 family protein [Gordonia zhenghanii]